MARHSTHPPVPSLYRPTEFWTKAIENDPSVFGPWDPKSPASSAVLNDQEEAFTGVLNRLGGRDPAWPRAIFEAGCGMGRLARYFERNYHRSHYDAIDLGTTQIESARSFHPAGRFRQADLLTYDIFTPWEDPSWEGYDLVVASEVLMHVRPEDLETAATNLLGLANPSRGVVVTIDWTPSPAELTHLRRRGSGGIAYWNFPHDYYRLFNKLGRLFEVVRVHRQSIFVVKP